MSLTPLSNRDHSVTYVADEFENGMPRPELLQQRSWVAALTLDGSHLAQEDVNRLTEFSASERYDHFDAVFSERLRHLPPGYRVSADPEGLNEFNRACGSLDVVLIPPDTRFVVACTHFDLLAWFGLSADIQRLAGTTGRQATLEFRNLVRASQAYNDVERHKLQSLILKYASFTD